MRNQPTISVVIPTRNRFASLNNCLNSLFSQTYPHDRFEVIVVDDGSTDKPAFTPHECDRFTPAFYLHQKQSGPAAARNLGLSHAKGEIVAFTDDDCLPDKNWLKEIVAVFAKHPTAAGVEGKTITKPKAPDLLTYGVINQNGGLYFSCNIAYRTAILRKLGGFDANFRYAHCEDLDLAHRVLKQGKIVFAPRALVIHPPRKVGIFSGLKRLSHLEDEFRLYLKHEDYFSQYFPVKNYLAVFFLITFGNHLWYRLHLLKDSWKHFKKNPLIWLAFWAKTGLEMTWVSIVFPKALWQSRKWKKI